MSDPEERRRIQAWADEPELAEAFYHRDGHEASGQNRRWDENHPYLFRNIAKTFKTMHTSHGHSLPLPEKASDVQHYQRLMQSMIKLARVAFRNGSKRDLHALWNWGHGVTGENGGEELLTNGLLHRDKLDLVGEHFFYQKFIWEQKNILVPDHLNSFVELHLLHALYEGPILGDLLFLRGLAEACTGTEFKPYAQLLLPPRKPSKKPPQAPTKIQTPQLFDAMDLLRSSVKKMPKRQGILRRDKDRIIRFINSFSKPEFKIKNLRDAVGHAKYEVGHGGVVFDIYEHLFLSLFDDHLRYKSKHGPTRRGHSPHPYQYRSVNRTNTEQMIRHAVAIHICVWAAYEEFRMLWTWKADIQGKRFTQQLAKPTRQTLDAVRKQLDSLRVPVAAKRAAVAKAQQERLQTRRKFSVTTEIIGSDSRNEHLPP